MALKSGRVGVNPKAVDRYGMPRPGDVYTKTESDAKYATKTQVNACVPKTQLTANSKDFIFAYDETTEKYGYKAGATGDFVPFNSGGGGAGWVKPSDLITTGLTPTACTIEDGGYIEDSGEVIFDLLLHYTGSVNLKISGLPAATATRYFLYIQGDSANDVENVHEFTSGNSSYINSSGDLIISSSYISTGKYIHIFGQYTKAT